MALRNRKAVVDTRTAARPVPIDKSVARDLAKKATREVTKFLKHWRPDDRDEPIHHGRGYRPGMTAHLGVYKTTDVEKNKIQIPVWLELKKGATGRGQSREYVQGGRVKTRFREEKAHGNKLNITVYLDVSHSPDDVTKHIHTVEREFYSVFIHEMTHVRDILYYLGDTKASKSEYMNRPTEVRAFMQQVVDEIEPTFKVAFRTNRRDILDTSDPEWAESTAYAMKSSDTIVRYLQKSSTWNRVKPHMTKKNREKILQAVAWKVQEMWDQKVGPLLKRITGPSSKYRLPDARVARVAHVARQYIEGSRN